MEERKGIGSFGIVYKAVHKMSKDIRAIKFISKSAVSGAEEAKLLYEINILKQLVTLLVTLGRTIRTL